MQHLRIGDQRGGRIGAYLAAEMIAYVAVVKGGAGAGVFRPGQTQALEGRLLILSQRLERKNIQGAGIRVLREALQHGEVIHQSLAAGRGRGDDDVPPRADMVRGLGLM